MGRKLDDRAVGAMRVAIARPLPAPSPLSFEPMKACGQA